MLRPEGIAVVLSGTYSHYGGDGKESQTSTIDNVCDEVWQVLGVCGRLVLAIIALWRWISKKIVSAEPAVIISRLCDSLDGLILFCSE